MSFIEDNPAFQEWARSPVEVLSSGTRIYRDTSGVGEPSVWINDTSQGLSVHVYAPEGDSDGGGKQATEWLNQFFEPDTDTDDPGDNSVFWEAGW